LGGADQSVRRRSSTDGGAAFGLEPSELADRLVLFAANATLLEVLPEERKLPLRGGAHHLEIDVVRQNVEALGARQLVVLRPGRQP
jgi:hypothetical protein